MKLAPPRQRHDEMATRQPNGSGTAQGVDAAVPPPSAVRSSDHPADEFRLEEVRQLETAPPALGTDFAIRESISLKGPNARLPTVSEIEDLKAKGLDVLISDAALREALSLGDQSNEFATREHVQGVVLSIDGYDSLDLDNALSFRRNDDGTLTVGVHATDVSAWIRPGGALDFSARRRATTRYPKRSEAVFPMLPRMLSEGKLSLFEGQPRLTKSVELTYTPDGELVKTRIFRSQLVNQFRLDSAAANSAFGGWDRGREHPELKEALQTMLPLGEKVANGGAQFVRAPLEEMVAAFTVAAAKQVGAALHAAGYETSYRNQDDATVKSRFDAEPTGYASAGVLAYTSWTGPMRRYTDLDTQRAMDRLIDDRHSSPRARELDSRMREIQLQRANGGSTDPRMDWLREMVDITDRSRNS